MNYKNFVFDFGNVLASFDGEELLTHFCEDKKDRALLKKIIFENWQALDGTRRIQHAFYKNGRLRQRLYLYQRF